jgi:act minimal PKS chain-length factor (CLF/KS beta)
MVGRLAGGAGALDVATALLALRDGVLPPTAHVDRLAPGCPLDLVRGEARDADLSTLLVVGRGWGGFNSAVVLGRVDDATR